VVNELAFAKLPVPLDVQVVPALLLALEPAVMFTAPAFAQVDTAVPAAAVGAVVIVNVFVDTVLVHPDKGLAVKESVTTPAVISAPLGAYVQVVNEVALAKLPVPLAVQATLDWLLALEPAVIFTAPLFEQVATAVPATAIGAALIAILTPLSAPFIAGVLLTTLILYPAPVAVPPGIVILIL
jgi:hypothetical protein